jgi:DNA-directed RNA polymerase subunit A"
MSLKETKVEDIASSFSINITDLNVEIILNNDKMKDMDLTNAKIVAAISKQIKSLNVKDNKESIIVSSKTKDENFNEIYKLKEKVKGVLVRGIKGIKQVLPVKRDEEFIIITGGSNLIEVLELEQVDIYRTTTNNIFEIQEVLGVEAARQAIMNEVIKVIENQGLNVDVRHIMLVADTMCASGSVKGITRYGIVSEKSSVLARASFETPIRHIINASLVGEVDELNSVVENVMLNQPVPIGTGLPGLKVDSEKVDKRK